MISTVCQLTNPEMLNLESYPLKQQSSYQVLLLIRLTKKNLINSLVFCQLYLSKKTSAAFSAALCSIIDAFSGIRQQAHLQTFRINQVLYCEQLTHTFIEQYISYIQFNVKINFFYRYELRRSVFNSSLRRESYRRLLLLRGCN